MNRNIKIGFISIFFILIITSNCFISLVFSEEQQIYNTENLGTSGLTVVQDTFYSALFFHYDESDYNVTHITLELSRKASNPTGNLRMRVFNATKRHYDSLGNFYNIHFLDAVDYMVESDDLLISALALYPAYDWVNITFSQQFTLKAEFVYMFLLYNPEQTCNSLYPIYGRASGGNYNPLICSTIKQYNIDDFLVKPYTINSKIYGELVSSGTGGYDEEYILELQENYFGLGLLALCCVIFPFVIVVLIIKNKKR